MYGYTDLTSEIGKEIECLRSLDSEVLIPAWIVTAVLGNHADIKGKDAEFYSYNARNNVQHEVRRQLNSFKLKPEAKADRQIVLPGFDRIQQYYLVARDGEQCAVHVDALTDDEFKAKLIELEAMADGCLEHKRELLRYQGRATRRCGELLREIGAAKGGRPKTRDGGGPSLRNQSAEGAGMSDRQRKQALRVANVPEADFDAQIEVARAA